MEDVLGYLTAAEVDVEIDNQVCVFDLVHREEYLKDFVLQGTYICKRHTLLRREEGCEIQSITRELILLGASKNVTYALIL